MDSVSADLDKVYCIVETDPKRYIHMVQRSLIEPKLTKEVTQSLRNNGLDAYAGPVPHPRGGDGSSIFEILKRLMDLKDYMGFAVALIKLPSTLIAHIANRIVGPRYLMRKPRIVVGLYISSKKYVTEDGYYDDLASRLIILNQAARAEAERLTKQYPLYVFTTTVAVTLPENEFRAVIDDQKSSQSSHRRLTNMAASVKFQSGLNLRLTSLRSGLVRHAVQHATKILDSPHHLHDWRFLDTRTKLYYTYFSGRMVGGYRKNPTPTMPYVKYYDLYLKDILATA